MDFPECYTETRRKARKAHKCACCFREIAAGSQYLDCTGIWNGRPDRYRIHAECHEIYVELAPGCYDGLPFECLREEVEAHGRPWPPQVAQDNKEISE